MPTTASGRKRPVKVNNRPTIVIRVGGRNCPAYAASTCSSALSFYMIALHSTRVSFAVTSAEKRVIVSKARKAGLSVGAYVRMRALEDTEEVMLRAWVIELAASSKRTLATFDSTLAAMIERDATLAERELRARDEVRTSIMPDELEELRRWFAAATHQTGG